MKTGRLKNALITIIASVMTNFCMAELKFNVPDFTDEYQATFWVFNNIQYDIGRISNIEFIQPPEVTLQKKSGVCQDKALLLMKIIKKQFGHNVSMIMMHSPDRTYNHAIVKVYNGPITSYLDPTALLVYENVLPFDYGNGISYTSQTELGYDLVMFYAGLYPW